MTSNIERLKKQLLRLITFRSLAFWRSTVLSAGYCDQHRYPEARPYAEHALQLAEKWFGSDHHKTADSYRTLANVLYEMGRYIEAAGHYEQALAIDERLLGRENPRLAITLGKLAECYLELGRGADAERLHRRGTEIKDKADGPDRNWKLGDFESCGRWYHFFGCRAEAERFLRDWLVEFEKFDEPDDAAIVGQLIQLAHVCRDQGYFEESEQLCLRALAIMEKHQGAEGPGVPYHLEQLARLYHMQGRYAEAEPLYRRSLALRESAGDGGDSATRQDILSGLMFQVAVLYLDQGRYAEALPVAQRCLVIAAKSFSESWLENLSGFCSLVALCVQEDIQVGAETSEQRLLAIFDNAHGAHQSELAFGLDGIGRCYYGQGRYREAEILCRRLLAFWEKEAGPAHPRLAKVQFNLAHTLRQLGHFEEAVRMEDRAKATRAKLEQNISTG